MEFCHPVKVDNTTTAAEWDTCINDPNGACPSPECLYDYGASIFPSEGPGFCAPRESTRDVQVIMQCQNSADRGSCEGPSTTGPSPCQWFKAKVVAQNQQLDYQNKATFESNFCHPPVTTRWDDQAPSCLQHSDVQSCE